MLSTEAVIVAAAIGAVAFAFILNSAISALSSQAESAAKLTETALRSMKEVAQSTLVLRGVHPHVAAPERFGPTGMSREDEDRLEQAKVQAEHEAATAESIYSQAADDALREAEAQFLAANPSARTGYGGGGIQPTRTT